MGVNMKWTSILLTVLSQAGFCQSDSINQKTFDADTAKQVLVALTSVTPQEGKPYPLLSELLAGRLTIETLSDNEKIDLEVEIRLLAASLAEKQGSII